MFLYLIALVCVLHNFKIITYKDKLCVNSEFDEYTKNMLAHAKKYNFVYSRLI